jgi:Phosphate-induced protein 1 conserved region
MLALAAVAAPAIPNPAQAAAAAAIGASNPIHFDFGRRPPHRGEPDKTMTQPTITMSFHGGPVQVTTTDYLVWWLPAGATLPANYQSVVDAYFADIGGSALYGVLTGYAGSNGTIQNSVTAGGAWTDATAYPKSIGYGDVVQSARRALAANPSWRAGLATQIYVLTAQNAPVAGSQFCAYHSYFRAKHDMAIYAYIPDPVAIDGCQTPFNVSPNHDLDVDSATTSINHEQAEMSTDPLIDAWYANSNDKYVKGLEVADVCIYDFGIPLKADGANFVFANGDEFMAQELFDNSTGNCGPTL